MENRWFNTVVVLFWMATMTWLIVEKVLPPLERGEPPNYRSIYAAEEAADDTVCWRMTWNGRPLGWAVNRVQRTESGMTEVHSRVSFARVPVEEMAPPWTRAFIRNAVMPLGRVQMDAFGKLEIDPLGRLSAFRSAIRVPGFAESMVIQGTVDGQELNLRLESAGKTIYKTERFLAHDALIGDELSPQGRMPEMHVGQTWTVPVFNPLRPDDSSPVEILEARVERLELIVWNDHAENTLLVVYRNDSGASLGASREPRGRLWVRPDGTVLKQEANVFGSRLTFVRLADPRPEIVERALAGHDVPESEFDDVPASPSRRARSRVQR